MKLVIQKNQNSSLMGKITYVLKAHLELTTQESENIKKYKLGKELLYSNLEDEGGSTLGFLGRAMFSVSVSIDDLVKGREFQLKDIYGIMDIENCLKEACETLKSILDTMVNFGGEEVIEF